MERAFRSWDAADWARIAGRALHEFQSDQVTMVAAGVAFWATLAIFPAVAALVWIVNRFIDFHELQSAMQAISATLPASTQAVVRQAMKSRLSGGGGASAFVGPAAASAIGFLFAFWSANSGMMALFIALNGIFQRTERRSYLRLTLISAAFTAGAFLLTILALALIVVGPYLLPLAGLYDWLSVWRYLKWPVLFAATAAALGALYRYAPNWEDKRWPLVTLGSLAAALVLTCGSAGFSWFVRTFASLSVTYGSLSTVVGFMLWLWLSFTVTLAGAELDAAIDRTGDKGHRDRGGTPASW
jgi:membrane protein